MSVRDFFLSANHRAHGTCHKAERLVNDNLSHVGINKPTDTSGNGVKI